METHLDARLHDHVALAEIELYSDVLIAVAGVEGKLTVEELDEILGVATDRADRTTDPACGDHDGPPAPGGPEVAPRVAREHYVRRRSRTSLC